MIVPFGRRISSLDIRSLVKFKLLSSPESCLILQCPLSRMCVCTLSTLPLLAPQYTHSLYSKSRVARSSRNVGMSQDDGMKSPWVLNMCVRFVASSEESYRQKRHVVDGGSSCSDSDSDSDFEFESTASSDEDSRFV
jgi:hypothetical protein